MNFIEERKNCSRRIYWSVISLAALSGSGTALAQTNAVASIGSSTNVTQLENITVVGDLDKARSQILPNLGATAYTHTADQIESQSQGDNAPLNQIVLRSPGVAQDSAANGDLHVRGEHANLQYRINDVLLPEGITGFGLELDPRFIDSLQLVTGSLPAQYGFRTAGVVDIKTKSGAFDNGGDGEVYGGSYDTARPSAEFGGSSGKFNYFVDGSYEHSALGIENPTSSHSAIHDDTDQFKTFTYMSYLLSDTSRVSFMGSASYSNFEVPNTPGLPAGTSPNGNPWLPATTFNSADLNEQQREQNYYGVLTYQKSAGDFNGQFSVYGRASGVHFRPDQIGDVYFNGVASDVEKKLYSTGLQGDASYDLGDKHTIRGGGMLLDETVFSDSATTVFPTDADGNPDGPLETLTDNHRLRGLFGGVYLQDEWRMFPRFTVNYGARFDVFNSSFDNEVQLSPRVNGIWRPTDSTTLHAGYSRYFTPPPIENVSGSDVALFNGTSNQSPGGPGAPDSPVKAERSDYFDAGLTQQITKDLTVGVDGYYKYAHNQLDDGLFGQTLILSAFNYAKGKVYGVEFTGNYTHGGFSAYANLAWSVAQGEDWNSAQFLFDPSDLAYVKNHWIYLDHDQRVTGSFGTAYTWKEGDHASTRVYVDAIYGSGLRTDETSILGTIPNGGSVPAYYTVNLGVEQSFKVTNKQTLKARLDVVNLTDNSYELRDGSGVGVNAAQYGARLGFFGSVSYLSDLIMDANRTAPTYELKSELARHCLPAANRDPNLKLAWVNSVCIVILLIGLAGARRGLIAIKPAPPLEQAVPVIVEPMTLRPQEMTEKKVNPEDNRNDAPRVNVVIPPSPAVTFSVPTVGSVVAPADLAVAPPLEPMRTATQIGSLNNTGNGGERPQPPYPLIAKESGEQGTVVLLLSGDATGNVVSVEVQTSSGFPVLDRATVDFIKRHWRLPVGTDNQRFQSSIRYLLNL